MSDIELDGEVLAEEDAAAGRGSRCGRCRCRIEGSASPVLRGEVRTAAIAAAGGVLAGAATVAAVRAVGAVGLEGRSRGRHLAVATAPPRRRQPLLPR